MRLDLLFSPSVNSSHRLFFTQTHPSIYSHDSLSFSQQPIIPQILETTIIMLAPSGIFSVVAGLVLLASPASARIWAGPVDMNEACSFEYGGGWSASLSGSSGNDWSCVNGGTHNPINVDAYCSQKYGNAAYADPQGGGAYDWGCYWR
ncbi:hypothetical protein V8C37DRAFT_285505 [Trichoderma ceciliae]